MTTEKLQELLQQGEGIDIEFKTSTFDLNKDIFDSICAFLNRMGGHLLLGVKDNGKVEGVVESCIPNMLNNLISNANNPAKLSPPIYLTPEVLTYEGRKIIYLYVPESTDVHSTSGRIFDRNGEGDLDITRQAWAVKHVYMRKYGCHFEDRVFPYFELADCNKKLFKQIRQMASIRVDKHPWRKMSDMDIIRSAGLYNTDPVTGKSGMTLAAILLLGKDTAIQNAISYHRTDALLRVENLDRYDDRDDIRTNLIDSHDRLMAFIAKHLPDKFYLEGIRSISLRDRLFREVVSNLLIHRAFSDGFPAKLIIERDRLYTENWSLARGWGQINPLKFTPFAKNPVIAKFFKQIGNADELGSGVRNIFKYGPEYAAGAVPELIEGDVFQTIIPIRRIQTAASINIEKWEEVRRKVRRKFVEKFGVKVTESLERPLELIFHNRYTSAAIIAEKTGISVRGAQKQLALMKQKGIIDRIGADKGGYWVILLE